MQPTIYERIRKNAQEIEAQRLSAPDALWWQRRELWTGQGHSSEVEEEAIAAIRSQCERSVVIVKPVVVAPPEPVVAFNLDLTEVMKWGAQAARAWTAQEHCNGRKRARGRLYVDGVSAN